MTIPIPTPSRPINKVQKFEDFYRLFQDKPGVYKYQDKINEILLQYSKEVYFMNATEISLEKFGQNQQVNLIMLGFAIATGKIPFIEMNHYEEVIKEWLREPDVNIKALHFGVEKGKETITSV